MCDFSGYSGVKILKLKNFKGKAWVLRLMEI